MLHTLQVVTNTSEEHKNRLREAAKGGGLLNAVRAAKSVRPHPNAKAQARPGEDEDTVVKVGGTTWTSWTICKVCRARTRRISRGTGRKRSCKSNCKQKHKLKLRCVVEVKNKLFHI